MKKILGVAVLALLALTGVSAQTAYDSAKVQTVMKTNFTSLKAAQKALKDEDSKAAAAAFDAIAKADPALVGMTPPKGSQADWDAAFNQLVADAQKGSTAAASSDWAGAKAALAALRADMKKGHEEFKS
jgi:cytochrome c556